MQTQPSPRLPQHPATEELLTRPDLRVVTNVRSPRLGCSTSKKRGLQPAPEALIALVAQTGEHVVRRKVHTLEVARV
jgi:hypothetical protein